MPRPASRRRLLSSLLVAFSRTVTARPASIWTIDIFTGPAPPPDQGPPLSAGALRDKSKLKYEIVGIVGAYLAWVLLTLILLLLVGRRLRKKTLVSSRARSLSLRVHVNVSADVATHMSAPSQGTATVDGPLTSPGKMASLRSWAGGGRAHSHKQSSTSISTVDSTVLEADRARNLYEMTKLYAAVMAHDEQKSTHTRSSGQMSPRSPHHSSHFGGAAPPTPRTPSHAPPTPRSSRHLPPWTPPTAAPTSPTYPPEFQHLVPAASVAPTTTSADLPGSVDPQAGPSIPRTSSGPGVSERSESQRSHRRKVTPLSIASGRSDAGSPDKRRPSRISVRGQPISQPLGSAPLDETCISSEVASMSLRSYNPGPPPPTPGHLAQPTALAAAKSSSEQERTQVSTPTSARQARPSTDSKGLPFRQFYADPLKSAPPTKTTFVDRRESMLGVHPKTGVPQTPYSPYVPFTPITPITPRTLVTKKEMKERRKKDALEVLSEDDLVMCGADMWGGMK